MIESYVLLDLGYTESVLKLPSDMSLVIATVMILSMAHWHGRWTKVNFIVTM